MNRNILIVGMGRSGKRHAKFLTSMGITTGILDINPINYDEVARQRLGYCSNCNSSSISLGIHS